MAKVESPDTSFYMNPAAYAQVNEEKKAKTSRTGKTDFTRLFDDLRGKTADEICPLSDLPVSEETVNALMDEVRDTGDILRSRPFPEEIMRYKQAVRNFMNYIVKNAYALEQEEGLPNYKRPSFKGKRGTPESRNATRYTKIQVIDKKLEDLAAMLLASQSQQMELVSRLEEIRGLLVDLLQ